MRLIDADAFIEEARNRIDMQDAYLPIHIKYFVIDEMPTIEAEPIRYGKWIMLRKAHNVDEDYDYDWGCSECGHVDCHNINVEVPYCWHCGARMEGVEG